MLVKMEVPDAEVWSSIFGSNFFLYSWWRSVTFLGNTTWEKPGRVLLVADDPHDPITAPSAERSRIVTMERLETSINQALWDHLIPSEPEEWDSADYADTILQIAVLGDVYYS